MFNGIPEFTNNNISVTKNNSPVGSPSTPESPSTTRLSNDGFFISAPAPVEEAPVAPQGPLFTVTFTNPQGTSIPPRNPARARVLITAMNNAFQNRRNPDIRAFNEAIKELRELVPNTQINITLSDATALKDANLFELKATRSLLTAGAIALRDSNFFGLSTIPIIHSLLAMENMQRDNVDVSRLNSWDIVGIDLENCTIRSQNGQPVDLTGARLLRAQMKNCNLANAILVNADFSFVNAESSNFENANMTNVTFRASVMNGASFRRAILSGSSVANGSRSICRFHAADFRGADLSGVLNFNWTNGQGGDLRGARYSRTTTLPSNFLPNQEMQLAND